MFYSIFRAFLIGYTLISRSSFSTIAAGIGIFIVGMFFMKDGFETLKQGIDLAQNAMDGWVGIKDKDITMKLSLFHTIFNIVGVLLVSPFVGKLVTFLEKIFIEKGGKSGRPKFLDDEVVLSPGLAASSLLNDGTNTSQISERLLSSSTTLWLQGEAHWCLTS